MEDQRLPSFVGPQLFRSTCRVQQNGVRALRNSRRSGRWDDVPAWRALQRVAECGGGQVSAALDEVQIAGHAMMDVMRERGDGLADARPIEAMAAAARDACNQRAFDLFLQIEDCRIPGCLDLAP